MRIYDPRVGRFLSVDPLTKKFAKLTPYQFASNRPIDGTDLDGQEYSPAGLNINPKTGIANPRATTAVVLIQSPEVMALVKKEDDARAAQKSMQTTGADMNGNAHSGSEYTIRDQIKIANVEIATQIGDDVKGGVAGSAGYLIAGRRGAAIGAGVDGIVFSVTPEGFRINTQVLFPKAHKRNSKICCGVLNLLTIK